jgi:hypothetical protein
MTTKENPVPRCSAGRETSIQDKSALPTTSPAEPRDFATVYVARRYGLPLSIAAVVARLAALGGALS